MRHYLKTKKQWLRRRCFIGRKTSNICTPLMRVGKTNYSLELKIAFAFSYLFVLTESSEIPTFAFRLVTWQAHRHHQQREGSSELPWYCLLLNMAPLSPQLPECRWEIKATCFFSQLPWTKVTTAKGGGAPFSQPFGAVTSHLNK